MSIAHDELAQVIHSRICEESLDDCLEWRGRCVKAAESALSAGYVKADHIEYAADHPLADIEFVDEDGDLWTDRDDFEDFFEDYDTKRVQRHVTAWEPAGE